MDLRTLDRTGNKYGYWTAISFFDRKNQTTRWLCRCICGTERVVIARSLASGKSRSCGCKQQELSKYTNKKHGMSGTRTYKSWHSMHQRCQGKGGHESYVKNGISVCKEWDSFEVFFADMGERPNGMTLDRIDNEKGYYKENCRWATCKQQSNNIRANVIVEAFGEKMTLTQAADKYNMGISCLRHRLRKGMSINKALIKPVWNNGRMRSK